MHRLLDFFTELRRGPGGSDLPHELFQVSTLNAVMEGVFDGTVTIGELRRHGDFGVGTFSALDGELVAVDGEFHQLLADGAVRPAAADQTTPFAVVLPFTPSASAAVTAGTTVSDLGALVDELGESANYFHAVRIDGTFERLTIRAVPKQERPYPRLVEATRHQSVFDMSEERGSIVAFRFPDYAEGINMPGLHLHFISDDRSRGGHVLEVVVGEATMYVDHTAEFHLELPETDDFAGTDIAKDERTAIAEAEGPSG